MTDEELLEKLLDRWEETSEPGRRPSPEEVCRDCPELLERFRQRLRVLARVDGFLQDTPAPPSMGSATRSRPTGADGSAASKPLRGEPTLPAVPGYEVLEVLGQGGMGVVYKARQQGLNRLVALKMVRRDYAASPQALDRFRSEAEAVARLQHPHVVAVHAWGEHDGAPFFALEFCGGGSLRDQLPGRPQPPAEAARLVEKLARAVQAAHEQGIVHRDLKPANVLLAPAGDEPALNTPWGIPKVGDFGLCRCFESEVQRTTEGEILGSPAYMAPEQAEGRIREVGPAADVWALGALLYELLTGRPPFGGASTPAVLHAVCYDEPPRPGELQPGVPAELENICLKCLRKPAGERYARAGDLAADLRAWLAGQPIAAAARGGTAGPAPSSAPHLPQTILLGGRRKPLGRWLAAAGLLLAALLGVGGWVRWGRTPAEKQPPTVLPPAEGKPLSIELRVFRQAADGFNPSLIGELGKSTYRVRLKDEVAVEAKLSEPAYAYLIAFNPAPDDKPEDQEQFVPLAEAGTPPRERPAVARRTLVLDDGEGLQVIAVVASRQPLPPYVEWKKMRPPLGWQRTPATSGAVWRADGVSVPEGFYDPGYDRAREGKAPDKTVVGELARKLKEMPGIDAVAVMGFAVDRLP
jgi:tRNA A-37 threonylcarbamoyl transferase component Bud32